MPKVECEHDHDGYATGYRHALDHVFEYVDHLAMNATGCRIRADEVGQKLSKAHYMGQEDVLKRLLEWISEEDGDDGDQLTVGGQGVPVGGMAAGCGCGAADSAGQHAAQAEGEVVHRLVFGVLGDGGRVAVGFLGGAGGGVRGHDRGVGEV